MQENLLNMKQFIAADDVSDINALVSKALEYKAQPFKDQHLGAGKRAGLLFLNPSLRTRLSTQIAAKNLGMESVVFNVDKEGWALEFEEGAVMNGTTVEHIKDAAPVLGSYFDILCIRTFPSLRDRDADYEETVLKSFIRYAGIPVVSLESATLHPLQSLTDVITIIEDRLKRKAGLKDKPKVVLTWAPHIKPLPQCVANSFAQWMNAWNEVEFVITHPRGFELDPVFSGKATITHWQEEALQDVDYIYVKNWSSYQDYGKVYDREDSVAEWMLNEQKLIHAPHARIMHCLPLRRNVELSDELLDGHRSLVTQQAGNRVWAAQTVFREILKEL